MKKQHPVVAAIMAFILAVILSATAMAVSIPSPGKSYYVYDGANILSDDTENYIIARNEKLYRKAAGSQIVVVTVNTTDDVEIREFADTLFTQWEIGNAEKMNGLLLLLAVDDDNYWVTQGGGIQASLSSTKIKNLLDNYLEPYFVTGDYDRGVATVFSKFVSSYEAMYSVDLDATEAETGDPDELEAKAGNDVSAKIVTTVLIVLILVVFVAAVIFVNRRLKEQAKEKERRERAAREQRKRRKAPALGTTYNPRGNSAPNRSGPAPRQGGPRRTGGGNRPTGRR